MLRLDGDLGVASSTRRGELLTPTAPARPTVHGQMTGRTYNRHAVKKRAPLNGGTMRNRESNTIDVDDETLVERSRGGDVDAFGELYRRHGAAVRRAVSDLVDDDARRDDLVQEVFTRAWAKISALRDAQRFRPWMFQIARNLSVDDLRVRKALRAAPIDDDEFEHTADDDPAVVAEVRQLSAALQDQFLLLSPRDAAAISMAVNLGFGPTEIGSALGISYGNAKVVLHRARARLRAAVDAAESDQTPCLAAP